MARLNSSLYGVIAMAHVQNDTRAISYDHEPAPDQDKH